MLLTKILGEYLQRETPQGYEPNNDLILPIIRKINGLGYIAHEYGVLACEVCEYNTEVFESLVHGERVCLYEDKPSTEALWLWPIRNGFVLRYDNGFCAGEATAYLGSSNKICRCFAE